MSELVNVGKTMKGTYQQICEGGFLNQFPGSEFRNESAFTGFGDVYIKSELVPSYNVMKEQSIEANGSFPIISL
jgi:hypothetical protein